MDNDLLQDVRSALEETRANLTHWLESTPETKQELQLGDADESAVQERLALVGQTLHELETGDYGTCEVCKESVDEELLRMDFTASVCLGHYSDQELRELEKELELSQVVQRAMLPQQPPSIPGVDTAGFSRPAQIVTGDYFDFVRFKDQSHGVIMGDVSGHGVSAAMLMSSLQTAFQTLSPEAASPLEVLQRINKLYLHNIRFTTFVTLFVGQYHPSMGTFRYVNAGHNAGYLLRSDHKTEVWLHPTGPAVGLTELRAAGLEEVGLRAGDTLVLYTDGLTEAVNSTGGFFGEDRLAAVIQRHAGGTAEACVQGIVKSLTEFTDGAQASDDTTVVVMKVR